MNKNMWILSLILGVQNSQKINKFIESENAMSI